MKEHQLNIINSGENKPDKDEFHDALEFPCFDHSECFNTEDCYFWDAEDTLDAWPTDHAFHFTVNHMTIGKGEKGQQHNVSFTNSSKIDEALSELSYNELTGYDKSFDTFLAALSVTETLQDITVPCYVTQFATAFECLQNLQRLQPKLAWKPLEVIKRTLENTTQYAKVITQWPMKKHHVSRFPWDNRRRLCEEVSMDTYFMPKKGYDGSTCAQLFIGLMSHMINIYPMDSKTGGNVLHAYQDFMHYEGAPVGLHCDLAPEQQTDALTNLNRDMMVKDTFSEAYHPNENPSEALGVRIIKQTSEMIMARTGAPSGSWPWLHQYIADINNHCAQQILNWKTPISKCHGYTPDISAFLQFWFWEPIYFKIDEDDNLSKEAFGHWLGVAHNVGDALTYYVLAEKTKHVICRSAGKCMIIEGGLYGLKTSAARFHEKLSAKLQKMGFSPCKADYDFWIRPKGDHYEYVATYVDDVLAFSRDPMSIISEIQKMFMLKGIGTPEYYLGGNFHTAKTQVNIQCKNKVLRPNDDQLQVKDVENIAEVGIEEKGKRLSSMWLTRGVKTAFSAES